MSRMICPTCQIWAVKDGDNYCSLCGHKFSALDLEIRPARFLSTEVPPPADLRITNRSLQCEVVIESIASTAPWAAVDLRQTPLPLRLGPGERRRFPVEIAPHEADGDYAEAALEVGSSAGYESVSFGLTPQPEVRSSIEDFELYAGGSGPRTRVARLEVLRGLVTVSGASAEPPEWITVENPPQPITLDARGGAALELRLSIDEERLLAEGTSFPAELRGVLRITGVEFAHEAPIVVRCWKPPELWIWEERYPYAAVFSGQRSELTLTLQNRNPTDPAAGEGNAALEIREIEVLNPDGTENQWLRPAEEMRYPLRIEGGAALPLRFAISTGSAGEGEHVVLFRLRTNLADEARQLRFAIDVRALPVFDGVLALDFGTSNTCAAVLHRSQDQYRLLPLDSPQHNPHPTTVPTVLQYCDLLPSGEKLLEIGALVEARYNDPRVVGSTVRSPKRHLGEVTESGIFPIRYFHDVEKQANYSAREVVADYLTRVRAAAEESERARFQRVVFTHPARFRMRQLQDLRAAVGEAFGPDCEIHSLQEPVAAALDFIVGPEALAREGYTLGVFDFGGGTTDLSLLRVENLRDDGFTEIRAHLISCAGRWFGGEDLTQFVLAFGLEQCRKLATRLHAPLEIPTAPRQAPDRAENWSARVNQSRLLHWAEATKLLLVAHGDEHEVYLPVLPDIFPELKLSVIAPSGAVEEIRCPHAEIVPTQADLYAYLKGEVAALGKSLAGLVRGGGGAPLDYLLLSGKSSAIPAVTEVLRREFPDARICMAGEPKECVVAGVCILEKFQHSSHTMLSITGTAATTSRIGIEEVGAGGSKVFSELVAAGVPIPEGGLRVLRPLLLHRRREIRLLENAGAEDQLWIRGTKNADIEDLGWFGLGAIPEWVPHNRPARATLELHLDQDLGCTLTARVEGQSEAAGFVAKNAERGGGDARVSTAIGS